MNPERRRSMEIALHVTLAILISTSCSPTTTGDPTPETVSTSSENGASDNPATEEAPPVDDPLDPKRFLTQPCTVLVQSQLASFNVTSPGEPTTTGSIAEQVGPWCTWLAPERSSSISVGFLTNNKGGLTNVYNSRKSFDYFEPTTVDGYPAVFAETQDLRVRGSCGIVVGVSETTTFRASEEGDLDAQGACDRAKRVAAAALETLRRGS